LSGPLNGLRLFSHDLPAAQGHRHIEDRAWRNWLTHDAPALKAISLPPELTLSSSHWIDFLQNGYLERHPESDAGFDLDLMTAGQMRGLLAVLEASPQFTAEPMSGWLRVRLGTVANG
jgi:hypothetical protein